MLGTPDTAIPAAQRIASMTSELVPPHLPSARTGRIRTPGAMPAVDVPGGFGVAVHCAAAMPDIWVPCQLLGSSVLLFGSWSSSQASRYCVFSAAVIQSPGSVGFASRPSPSLATKFGGRLYGAPVSAVDDTKS